MKQKALQEEAEERVKNNSSQPLKLKAIECEKQILDLELALDKKE
jgi:hypothetical protein